MISQLQNRILLVDGAMGTMLQAEGLAGCPELAALEHPEILARIHRTYEEAGADIHTTNSFGGTRFKLAAYGLAERVHEINRAAAKVCRDAVKGLVAGSLGPTGRLMAPYGELSFDEAYEAFLEQVIALKEGGVDLFVVETMSDLLEAKAALLAALTSGLPVGVNLTFNPDGRTLSGTPPEVSAAVLTAAGATFVGANCSVGPRNMLPWVRAMKEAGARFVWAAPNAGMPFFDGKETRFPEGPQEFARFVLDLAKAGANPVGGCCGTTPAHIKAAKQALEGFVPAEEKLSPKTRLASRSRLLTFTGFPRVIGERLNPTGKPKLKQALLDGDWAFLHRLAREQSEGGAELLDVNVGVGGDEQGLMRKAVEALIDVVDLPLTLDSSDPKVLEAGLKAYPGKALINSVSGEASKLDTVLPLAKRYGAAVIGLLLDEHGIPDTVEGRLNIARTILERALALGIPREDLFFDPLVLTAGADPKNPAITLGTLEALHREGLLTVMGLSNVSFGLPKRPLLNRTFLAAAVTRGLSAPILNPSDGDLMEELYASALLMGCPEALPALTKEKKGPEDPVVAAMVAGDKEGLWALAQTGLEHAAALEVINSLLLPGMNEIGSRFKRNELFLPQVLAAADAMRTVLERLAPMLPSSEFDKGTIVLATVQGDIHDIGKNIVGTLLRTAGWKVIDLGKDVAPEAIVEAAKRADLVGLSALMTTTAPMIKTTVEQMRKAGISTPVLVGGAVLTEDLAHELGADAFAPDAVEAVEAANRLVSR